MVHAVQRILRSRALGLSVVTLATSGCFRYVPAQLETTPAGEGVRVLVTRQGATELASVAEVDPDVPRVDGTVVGVEEGTLLLQVPVGRRQEGFIASNLNQMVRVPTGEILSFQRRELDGFATGALLAGSAVVITAAIAFIFDPFGDSSLDPEDPPDDLLLRFGLFSIPIG